MWLIALGVQSGSVVHIAVEYCAPCRPGGEAATTRHVLSDRLRKYDEIEAISLAPSPERVFRVSVNGEAVWRVDPADDIDPIEAVAAVRQRLSA
jgi:predicted Rdx family selenoprotein